MYISRVTGLTVALGACHRSGVVAVDVRRSGGRRREAADAGTDVELVKAWAQDIAIV